MFTISSSSRCHFLCAACSLHPTHPMASSKSKGDPNMEPDMTPASNGTGVRSFGGAVAHVDDNNHNCAVPVAIVEEAGANMMHSLVWGLNKGKRKARTRRAFTDHAAQGATEKPATAFETMKANLLAPQKLQEDSEMSVVTSDQRRVPEDDKAIKWAYLDDVHKRDDLLTWNPFLLHEPDSPIPNDADLY